MQAEANALRFAELALSGMVAVALLVAALAFEDRESDWWQPDGTLSLSKQVPCCTEGTHSPLRIRRMAIAPLLTPGIGLDSLPAFEAYLAGRIGQPLETVRGRTLAEMDAQLQLGEADFVLTEGAAYVRGHRQMGLVPVAVPIVRGERTSRAFLVVRQNSAIRTWPDMRGMRVALTDLLSTSGRMVPTQALAKVNVMYTHGVSRSIQAVAEGLVDGATVDGLAFKAAARADPSVLRKVRVVWRSGPFPNGPVAVHPRVPAQARQRLGTALLGMSKDPSGRKVLAELGFDRFEAADPAAYAALEAAMP